MTSPDHDDRPSFCPVADHRTVRNAIDAARAHPAGMAVLIIGLQDCDACVGLRDDMTRLARNNADVAVYYGSLTLDAGKEEYAAIAQLGVNDFPTTLIYDRGNLLHGWVGYNHRLPWGERAAALDALLHAALARRPAAEPSARPDTVRSDDVREMI